MTIKNKKILSWINEFWDQVADYGEGELAEMVTDEVMVTRKMFKGTNTFKNRGGADAYVTRICAKGNTAGAVGIPLFKIVFLKEFLDKCNRRQFLYTLAHECGHVLFAIGNRRIQEQACDVLAETFFGYPKANDDTSGYLYGDKAFKKTFGKTPDQAELQQLRRDYKELKRSWRVMRNQLTKLYSENWRLNQKIKELKKRA